MGANALELSPADEPTRGELERALAEILDVAIAAQELVNQNQSRGYFYRAKRTREVQFDALELADEVTVLLKFGPYLRVVE